MSSKKRAFVLLCLLPLFLFFSTEEESHGAPLAAYLGKILNFLVLFGGLGYMLRKPLMNFLETRSTDIKNTIQEAKREREENEQRAREALERLEGLKAEIEKIRREAEKDAQSRKEDILAAADKEAERIKHFAAKELEFYRQLKLRELRTRTAELATSLAEARIQAKMTPDKQAALIDSSIEKLEGLYDK